MPNTTQASRLASALLIAGWLAVATSSADTQPEPTRSSSERLEKKRYVAAGDRAYVVGLTNGRFEPLGWHVRGAMGGVWANAVRLLEGYSFAVDGQVVPGASRFTSGAGFVRMDFPPVSGLELTRTEFAPHGQPVVMIGLRVRNQNPERRAVKLEFFAGSQLRAYYPWDWTSPTAQSVDKPDTVAFDAASGTLRFEEPPQPWSALVASSLKPVSGNVGPAAIASLPQGAPKPPEGFPMGRLEWTLALNAGAETTVWVAVAGSHTSSQEAETALRAALGNPAQVFERHIASRRSILERSRVRLPDARLQAAFEWGKSNLLDHRRTLTKVAVRDVDAGRAYPAPKTVIERLEGISAGFPDYPSLFGTDGAYTVFALVASGQFETARNHLRAIRDASRVVNGSTGKVIHELTPDGAVYFGSNAHAGNTNETAQFAIAVDLLWRWTGERAWRDEMYDFVRDGLRYILTDLDRNGNGSPEGNGMVERSGMGVEKLDVTAYTHRALDALERMARSRGDASTERWARERKQLIQTALERNWWMPRENLYADSMNGSSSPLQQRHWINAVPMELELATRNRAAAALGRLESPTFTGTNGLYHTGIGGGSNGQGERRVWTLPNAVMAVAEANYGRLPQALRYMNAISSSLDLEMPGALPEVLPSPEYNPFQSLDDRAMVMQAWSSYGVQWPVVHHIFGVRPNLNVARIVIVPQLPPGWTQASVEQLRIARGSLNMRVSRNGKVFTTFVDGRFATDLSLGHVLPVGSSVASVTLDGQPTKFTTATTNRGLEVRVETRLDGERTLVVTLR
jgi:glycogen debranching enzyme